MSSSTTKSSACPSTEVLQRFVLGKLSPADVEQWAGHIEACAQCTKTLAGFQAEDTVVEALRRQGGEAPERFGSLLRRLGGDVPATKEPSTDGPVAPGPESLPRIPGYEILEVLGRGGMGVVYHARQTALRRPVALKMVRAGAQASSEELARFRAEAQAVARLRHANIVQIYEVDQHEGCPYIALEYVAGGTLAQRLGRQPQPVRACADVVEALARGVHYAHSLGIVHRDLKPANVLLQVAEARVTPTAIEDTLSDQLDLQQAVPKITDFGLAKYLEEDAGNTRTGAVLGTAAYMAPEQAAGHSKDIGPAADIYALGVILYEMLTGRTPFVGATALAILEQVRTRDPERPTRFQPRIHRDLETICLKALDREPARRYPSALELADDLARFNAGEPIKARPEGWVRRWRRRVLRHRGLAAAGLAAALLVLAAGLTFWSWTSRNRTVQELSRKINAAIDAPELADGYRARLEADLAALESLDVQEAADARQRFDKRYGGFRKEQRKSELARTIEAAGDAPELSQAYWQRLKASLGELDGLDVGLAGGIRLRWGRNYARFLEDRLRNPNLPPAEVARLKEGLTELEALTPALAAPVQHVYGQRAAGWNPLLRWAKQGADKLAFFEPDQVAVKDDVVMPRIVPGDSGIVLTNQAGTNHDELTAEFDERWEAGTGIGLVLNAVRHHRAEITALAYAPEGGALASASGSAHAAGVVKVWDQAGRERFTFHADKPGALALAYFPDGSALAVACTGDPRVRLLDPATGKIVHEFMAHEGGSVGCLAMARDGRTLATGSGVGGKNGEVRLWDTQTWKPRQTFAGFDKAVVRLALSPDGRLLAAAGSDRAVKVWDLAERREKLAGLPFFWHGIDNTLLFTSDSRTMIAPFNLREKAGIINDPILFWNTSTGQRRAVPIGFSAGGLSAMALAPTDRYLAVASQWNGHLMLLDVATGQGRFFQKESLPNWFSALAFSPDGSSLAIGTREGAVQVRHVETGRLRHNFENQGYGFWVRTQAEAGKAALPINKVRAQNGDVTVAIVRNGQVLREEKVSLSNLTPGPLQLMARRDGHRLVFQVNQLPPLEFQEVQPLPAQGVFALAWPAGAGLTSVQVMRRNLADRPSPLEGGDELLARSLYLDALPLYRAQAVAAGPGDKEVGQEARLKAALCLLHLQRLDEASVEFERLAGESGPRWPAVAACELLALYLNQGRSKDVDTVLDVLTQNYAFEKLLPLVSKEARAKLLYLYTGDMREVQLLFQPRAIDLRNLDRATKIHDYFKVPMAERVYLRLAYLRGYHLHGKLDLAVQAAEDLLADERYWGRTPDRKAQIAVVEKLGWVLRQQGKPHLALGRVNHFLEGASGTTFKGLLLERAHIHVALENWGEAERDLDEFVKLEPERHDFRRYAGAWLARGFLHKRRGNEAAALKAWKNGLMTSFAARFQKTPGDITEGQALLSSVALDALFGTMAAALTDELGAADADAVLASMLSRRSGRAGGDNPFSLFQERMPLPPGILREMWRTPRGLDCARKLAYQNIPYAEWLRLPLILVGAENGRQSAMPRDLSAEQDAILWDASERVYQAYMDDKLQIIQVGSLVLTWKGTTNFLGWAGLAPSLEPSVRGPLAYVLGQRYLTRLQKPAEARTFFETAARDAPPGSTLKRLAEAEVKGLLKAR